MKKILIVCESGSDLTKEQVARYGFYLVPMHVAMGERNLDDGAFPVSEIFAYYDKTKKVPKTSATNPEEYREMFERLHREYPEAEILHLCYSAVTTATWQNALIGSEDMDYVRHIDTKNVAGGQAFLLVKAARYLEAHPDTTVDEFLPIIEDWIKRTRFAFLPKNLAYLKAGGRVSNAAYIGATLLNLKAMIELKDGYLVGTKKYRGNMDKVVKKMTLELINQYHFEKDELYFVCSEGLDEGLKRDIERFVDGLGYHNYTWIPTGGVISCHGGPGAFGLIGMEGKA